MLNRPRTLILALALAAFTTAGFAQEPQEETPSLTTEDVKGPEPVVAPAPGESVAITRGGTPPTVDQAWEEIYRALAREGIPAADLDQLRTTIDGGGEVSVALRFDVGTTGRVENLVLRRPSGIGWIDRKITEEAPRNGLGPDVANYRDVEVDLGVSRGRLRASATLTAPSVEKAESVEMFLQMLSSGGPHSSAFPGITHSRSGATVSVSLDLSFDDLLKRRS